MYIANLGWQSELKKDRGDSAMRSGFLVTVAGPNQTESCLAEGSLEKSTWFPTLGLRTPKPWLCGCKAPDRLWQLRCHASWPGERFHAVVGNEELDQGNTVLHRDIQLD